MNKRQLNKIKSVLTRAIKAHIKSGGKLIAGDFYLGGGKDNLANDELVAACKCPVQIVTDNLYGQDKQQHPSTSIELSKVLGFTINRDEMYAIIDGYDKRKAWGVFGKEPAASIPKKTYNSLYAIGFGLRKIYKPLTTAQINKIMGFPYV